MFIYEPIFLWWVIASCAVLAVFLRGVEMYLLCQDRSEEWERLYRMEQHQKQTDARLDALENKAFRP